MQTFFEITFLTEFVMILEVTTLKIHKTLTNIYILSKKTFQFKDFFSDNLNLKKNSEILKINEFMIDSKPPKMAHFDRPFFLQVCRYAVSQSCNA